VLPFTDRRRLIDVVNETTYPIRYESTIEKVDISAYWANQDADLPDTGVFLRLTPSGQQRYKNGQPLVQTTREQSTDPEIAYTKRTLVQVYDMLQVYVSVASDIGAIPEVVAGSELARLIFEQFVFDTDDLESPGPNGEAPLTVAPNQDTGDGVTDMSDEPVEGQAVTRHHFDARVEYTIVRVEDVPAATGVAGTIELVTAGGASVSAEDFDIAI
jgi:hypothetical protein